MLTSGESIGHSPTPLPSGPVIVMPVVRQKASKLDPRRASLAGSITEPSRPHRLQASRAGKPYELESSFVGDFDDRTLRAKARVLKGREEFTVAIDPRAHLVVVRQLFDHAVPNQRAKIYVDAIFTCEWFRPGSNTVKRWCELDAMLPPGATSGRRSIRIKIVPSTEWTEASYTIYSVVAPGTGKKLTSMASGETEADPGH